MLSLKLETTLCKKNSVHCCLNTFWTALHRSKSYAMSSEGLQTTYHQKKILCNVVIIPLGQYFTGKTRNIVWEAPDNIVHVKIKKPAKYNDIVCTMLKFINFFNLSLLFLFFMFPYLSFINFFLPYHVLYTLFFLSIHKEFFL